MKNSRRIKRMARNRKKVTGLNLTSLMDVFTILVVITSYSIHYTKLYEGGERR